MKNELSVIYVTDSLHSNFEVLSKLYEKLKKEDLKWEFVISSPSEDVKAITDSISFAGNKNNVICVKAKHNSLYSSVKASLHVANYKTALLIKADSLTEENVDAFDVSTMLKETNVLTDFNVLEHNLGISMKTFYVKSMVNDIKFSDKNMFNEIVYTSGTRQTKEKTCKKYFRKGLKLKQLYGVG